MATAAALGLVKGIVFAKVLGARQLGYYGLVVLVTQFGTYATSWGILSALNTQLPMAFGRGEADVDEIVGRSLGSLVVSSLGTAALYLVVVGAIAPSDTSTWIALGLAAALTVATTLCEFHFLLLRVKHMLVPLGAMYLLRSITALGLGIVAGELWGFRGVVCSELTALVLAMALARRRWLGWVRIRRPTWARMLWLLRWGFPLLMANLVVTVSSTLDRVFVASAKSAQLGQYVFASLAVVAWAAIFGMLAQAVGPRLLFDLGAGQTIRRVRARAIRLSLTVSASGIGGLVALLAARGWLLRHVFHGYAQGLHVMPILYAGGMISMLAFPGFIVSALRPKLSLVATSLGALVAAAGGSVLAARGASLRDFALVFVASQAVVAAAQLAVVEWFVRHAETASASHAL